MHELENKGPMKKILLVDDRKVYCTALAKYIEIELGAAHTEVEVKPVFSLDDLNDHVNCLGNVYLILLNIDLDNTEAALWTLVTDTNPKANIAIILRTTPAWKHGDLLKRILSTARGILSEKMNVEAFMAGLERLTIGEYFLSEDVFAFLQSLQHDNNNELTLRETKVAELLVLGATNKQIAEGLNISLTYTFTVVSNIYNKLGVSNRVSAVNLLGSREHISERWLEGPARRISAAAGKNRSFNTRLSIDEMAHFASARRAEARRHKDRPMALGIGDGRPLQNPLARPGLKRSSGTKRLSAKKTAKKATLAPTRGRPAARTKISPASPPPKAVNEIVECSVFAPAAAPPGKTILIQVFLHLANQAERARFLATTMDASAKLKGAKPLDLPIKRGARVEVAFSANGLAVDEPVQSVVWQGEPTFCQFRATIPKGTNGDSFLPVVRVSVDGKLIGRIAFSLSSDDAASRPASEPLGDHAKLYKYAFVSYASKDRKEVLKRVQMLEVMKTKFFQDILSLDPGDRWEKKLYENIDRCDLFLLFWSQAAKDSQWVLKEAEYALAHQQKNPGSEPDLVPVVLEQNVLPPPNLSGFHFNDRISYLISRKP